MITDQKSLEARVASLMEDCSTYEEAAKQVISEVGQFLQLHNAPSFDHNYNEVRCRVIIGDGKPLPKEYKKYRVYSRWDGRDTATMKVGGALTHKDYLYLAQPNSLPVPPKPPSFVDKLKELRKGIGVNEHVTITATLLDMMIGKFSEEKEDET